MEIASIPVLHDRNLDQGMILILYELTTASLHELKASESTLRAMEAALHNHYFSESTVVLSRVTAASTDRMRALINGKDTLIYQVRRNDGLGLQDISPEVPWEKPGFSRALDSCIVLETQRQSELVLGRVLSDLTAITKAKPRN